MQKQNTKRATKRVAHKRDRSQTITIDFAAGERKDQKQADLILAFLSSPINNFLRETIVEALAEAAWRSGHSHLAPTLKNGKVVVSENSNPHFQDLRRNLKNLLLFTSNEDFTLKMSEREQLARHILGIYKNPETPVRLYNHVANFLTDGTGLKVFDAPGDVSLLEAWQSDPQTIERIIELSNKHDEVSNAN